MNNIFRKWFNNCLCLKTIKEGRKSSIFFKKYLS